MKGIGTDRYLAGVCLTVLGGASLAEVSTSNHGGFWISAIVFSVGYAICIYEFMTKGE